MEFGSNLDTPQAARLREGRLQDVVLPYVSSGSALPGFR
jgi:hypothetical protein